jgi:hypothetical protein
MLDSNAQNPKLEYRISCWHLIAPLLRFRVIRGNSLRGIERYARRIRGLAFGTYVLRVVSSLVEDSKVGLCSFLWD